MLTLKSTKQNDDYLLGEQKVTEVVGQNSAVGFSCNRILAWI